jgi:putative transposase
VPRPAQQHTFQVLPRRWVVERTFAWLGRQRRLSKDYEALPETGFVSKVGFVKLRLTKTQLAKGHF